MTGPDATQATGLPSRASTLNERGTPLKQPSAPWDHPRRHKHSVGKCGQIVGKSPILSDSGMIGGKEKPRLTGVFLM